MKTNTIPRIGAPASPWKNNLAPFTPIAAGFQPETVYDCLVAGSGITGLTAALLSQQAGKKCLLAEADSIGFGTTGGTSAHINTFADTTYKDTKSAFGEQGAKLFAGFALNKDQIGNLKIDCGYEPKTGNLYVENEDDVKLLADSYGGAVKVGVQVQYIDEVPTPVPFQKAPAWYGHAQFTGPATKNLFKINTDEN